MCSFEFTAILLLRPPVHILYIPRHVYLYNIFYVPRYVYYTNMYIIHVYGGYPVSYTLQRQKPVDI